MMPSRSLKQMYFEMLRIRLIEERIAELYPEQEMRCPVHLCIGQEAIAVGVCAALGREDYVLSNHRSHGHYLAKGGELRPMLAELYGKEAGCSRGKGGSMHLIDRSAGFLGASPIVGSTIPIAVGVAFGASMRNESRVTAAFFGDGATEEGVFHESLNFAALKRLPVIFVCENNLYSVYSPLHVRQPEGRSRTQLAQGHGIPSFLGDGNDLGEVVKLAEAAAIRARQGEGPTFLEFSTYRWREHCGPYYDNDLGYRSPEEFAAWQKRCPVERVRTQLVDDGFATKQELDAMVDMIQSEMKDAVSFAQECPFPEPNLLGEHVYAP